MEAVLGVLLVAVCGLLGWLISKDVFYHRANVEYFNERIQGQAKRIEYLEDQNNELAEGNKRLAIVLENLNEQLRKAKLPKRRHK